MSRKLNEEKHGRLLIALHVIIWLLPVKLCLKYIILCMYIVILKLHTYRYVRSLSSHEPIGASLPSKESLLSLVDTHVLKLPPVYHDRLKSKSRSSTSLWPFNVFEELELLDLLRVQIEDRPNLEVRLALFDALFGLIGRNSQVSAKKCFVCACLQIPPPYLNSLVIRCISNINLGRQSFV